MADAEGKWAQAKEEGRAAMMDAKTAASMKMDEVRGNAHGSSDSDRSRAAVMGTVDPSRDVSGYGYDKFSTSYHGEKAPGLDYGIAPGAGAAVTGGGEHHGGIIERTRNSITGAMDSVRGAIDAVIHPKGGLSDEALDKIEDRVATSPDGADVQTEIPPTLRPTDHLGFK